MYASRLAVIKGPDEGKEFTIPVRGGGIGRGQWNAIQLSDPEISRSHCVIEPHGSSLLLIDLGSRSGIKVNGQAVTKHTLSQGDLIILGRTYLTYIGPESIGASATSEQVSMPGAEVLAGRYELLSLLGVGGMGSVYRVRDRTLDEVIAVKVLRRDLAESNEAQRRFRHEVKLARRVTHRNMARIFDIGSHGGELFLTMELVEGESLSNMLARRLRLPPKMAIELCLELCAGLAAAHAAGVVHRDLKPDNVLIAVDGRVVITDFGIAVGPSIVESAEHERHVMGTPAYVAPEVVRGYPVVDARADIYSLGAVLFEMVTGWAPWAGNNPIEVATARLFAPPPDPRKHVTDLPEALVEVIMHCMAQDRDDRYATVGDIAEELAALPEAAAPDAAPRVVLREHSGNSPIPVGVFDERALKRVAVLPFDTTGSTDEAYLAEGFTAELIDFLSMVPGLRVCAHGQVTPFGARRDDLRAVGRELGVDIVVLGTIDRHDDGVHIDARAINVVDGFQLWAKRFDADPGALFSVNDEAARAIAQALTLSMHAPPVRGSVDPVAIDLYLRGRSQYRKIWAAPTERAVELFEQARAREPSDPSILAGCALARARLGFHQGGDDSAKTLAQQAVVLAPNHAEARLALATAHFQEFDFATALAEVGHAIAISPALAEAHLLLGRILIETNPVVAAVQCLEKAVFLDSHLYFGYRDLARAQLLLGYSLEAAKVCLDQLPMEPSARIIQLFERVRMAMWRHSREEAELLATELSDPSVPDVLPIHMGRQMVAMLLGQAGVPTDFAEQVELDRGGGRRRAFFWQIKAELHACSEEAEPCLDAIAQAVDAGMFDTVWLERCPLLELVTHSSRFAQLREIVRQRSQPIFRTWRRTWRRDVRSD